MWKIVFCWVKGKCHCVGVVVSTPGSAVVASIGQFSLRGYYLYILPSCQLSRYNEEPPNYPSSRGRPTRSSGRSPTLFLARGHVDRCAGCQTRVRLPWYYLSTYSLSMPPYLRWGVNKYYIPIVLLAIFVDNIIFWNYLYHKLILRT